MPTTNVARKRKAVRSVVRASAGPVVALLLNYCAFRLHFNLSTASSINLLVIVLTALKFGFWEATGSSLLAVACLDYFYTPPILSFRIVDPQDWMALVSFEFTALVVSRLSIQVQNHMRAKQLSIAATRRNSTSSAVAFYCSIGKSRPGLRSQD